MNELIYDRTAQDVSDALEIRSKYQKLGNWSDLTDAEESQLERGTYTINALNRVGRIVNKIASEFRRMGLNAPVELRTDWSAGDTFTKADILIYLDAIAIIRREYVYSESTPPAPDISRWIDYKAANDIERILFDTEAAITSSVMYTPRSGTISAGQTRRRYKYAFDPDAIYAIDLGNALEIISDVVTAHEDGDALYITAPEGSIRME